MTLDGNSVFALSGQIFSSGNSEKNPSPDA